MTEPMDVRVRRLAGKFELAGPSGAAAPFSRVSMRNEAYLLNPPLPAGRVEEFEREHGVRLPEAYRRFVTEIGDGDPDGHLYSLDRAMTELGWLFEDDEEFPNGRGVLARPSPYRRGETYSRQWWDEHWGPDERLEQLFGSLPVSQGGGSFVYFLVVTGPDAGAVYYADYDGNEDVARVGDDYLSWQERGLDGFVLDHFDRWADGMLAGGEHELVDILTGDPHEYRRMLAALSLRTPHTLSGRTRRALSDAALRDEHYVVRAMAVSTIRHRGDPTQLDTARRAVRDEANPVRSRALRCLVDLQDPTLPTIARSLLADRDPSIRERAISLLREADELTAPDLVRLLDDPKWTVRRAALWAAADLTDPVPVLTKALSDESGLIRGQAIDLVVASKDPGLTAELPTLYEKETDSTVRHKLAWLLGLLPASTSDALSGKGTDATR